MSPPIPFLLPCSIVPVAEELAGIPTPTCKSPSLDYDSRVQRLLDIEAEEYYGDEEDSDGKLEDEFGEEDEFKDDEDDKGEDGVFEYVQVVRRRTRMGRR